MTNRYNGRPPVKFPGLRRAREAAGRTLEDAANAAQISITTLSRVERGIVRADEEILESLRSYYKLTWEEIRIAYRETRRSAQRRRLQA